MPANNGSRLAGRLELLCDLVNSLDYPAGRDQLATPETATQWCRSHGFAPISNQSELERLREFRESLRTVLSGNTGQGQNDTGWQVLQPFLRASRFSIVLKTGCAPALDPGGAGCERTIALMLGVVYDAVLAGTWARVRACRKDSCRFAYYDRSKNGQRAWCSMAVCGNREKAQRRRRRERPGPGR